MALAGASDVLCRLTFSGFNALRLVDTGAVPAVLPEPPGNEPRRSRGDARPRRAWRTPRRRGANIYAEVAGYGVRCEAYHPTAPEPEGKAVAALIEDALRAAEYLRGRRGSRERARHGDAAKRSGRGARHAAGVRRAGAGVPVTSIKSMVGHCLAAAGAIEAATLALSIAEGCRAADRELP